VVKKSVKRRSNDTVVSKCLVEIKYELGLAFFQYISD